MATRRLTDAFLLLRNNSIQNRQLLAEQVSSHTTSSPLHSRSIAAVSLPAASPTHALCALRLCLSVCLCLSLCLKKDQNNTEMHGLSARSGGIYNPGWGEKKLSGPRCSHLCLPLLTSATLPVPSSPPLASLHDRPPPIYICFNTKIWKRPAFLKPFCFVCFMPPPPQPPRPILSLTLVLVTGMQDRRPKSLQMNDILPQLWKESGFLWGLFFFFLPVFF